MVKHLVSCPRLFSCSLRFGTALAIGLVMLAPGRAVAQDDSASSALSQRIANYEMSAFLDPATREIDGEQTLTWRNTTDHPAGELRFHLYYNAWLNDRSSFLRHARNSALPSAQHRADDFGACIIRSVRIEPRDGRVGSEVTDLVEPISPNDGNPHDRTVIRFPVDPPVAPGETIEIRTTWTSKIPRTFRRTGVRGDTYFIAQWFPKIGVFEADGTWNCHQFIQTEFFADFGNYDVRITVPDAWVVGATGERIERTKNDDGTATHHFIQNDVHDFAWTTAPDYIAHERQFEVDGLPPVRMRLLLRPDRQSKKDRYFDATATTLETYGRWFGAYPYGHVTIVDPPFRLGAGGMEYPTLFTGGTRWLSPPGTFSPEGVTIHETGHQWWYGLVANNEFEHAWLDEGINTYCDRRVRAERYPVRPMSKRYFNGVIPLVFHELPTALRIDGSDRYRGFHSVFKTDSMANPSWKLGPRSYGRLSYDKPALMLRTLENLLGWDVMQRILQTFFERYRFAHPTPDDFFAVVEEVAARDLGWFFEATYYGSGLFDFAVDTVESRRITKARGDRITDAGTVEPIGDDGVPPPEGVAPGAFESHVLVRRFGDAPFPVDIRVTFTDGESVTETWDGVDRWKRFDYIRNAKVERVEVDPERVLVLDVDSVNNTWIRDSKARRASVKWSARWMVWLQNMLEQLAAVS